VRSKQCVGLYRQIARKAVTETQRRGVKKKAQSRPIGLLGRKITVAKFTILFFTTRRKRQL
jgi:hypothetical protein